MKKDLDSLAKITKALNDICEVLDMDSEGVDSLIYSLCYEDYISHSEFTMLKGFARGYRGAL